MRIVFLYGALICYNSRHVLYVHDNQIVGRYDYQVMIHKLLLSGMSLN